MPAVLDGIVVALVLAWACARAWRRWGPSGGSKPACGSCPVPPLEQKRPGPSRGPSQKP
jgi:hypothetical protein